MNIDNIIQEEIQNLFEVRYIEPYKDIENNIPLKDNETIVVFHGFNKFDEALLAAKFGLSGKERADRLYSYEYGNNPKGLFVSVDFNKVKKEFAHGGVIMEFATKVSELEAPVWVGGRSYFVQGEYTQSFKDDNEREQQRLLNREKHKTNTYPAIAQSDRPELADTLYNNAEFQALYTGDLNPNMIRTFWVNEVLKNERRTNGQWVRMTRDEFLQKYYTDENLKQKYARGSYDTSKMEYSDKYNEKINKIFQPAEDFNIDKLKKYLLDMGYDYNNFVEYYVKRWDSYMINSMFYPKQQEQLKQYYNISNNETR